MLYYMLTDYQLPSPDDYDEQEEIPYISEFTQIDSELEEVIMKSLNRKQNERPNLLNLQIMLKK